MRPAGRRAAVLAAGMGLLAGLAVAVFGGSEAAAVGTQEPAAVVTLSTGGHVRASTAVGPLTSGDVIVPGDERTWGVEVRNAAHEPGRLSATIVDVRLTGAVDEEFLRDFTIMGRQLGSLLGERTVVATRHLDAGASTVLLIGYEFALSATSGNHPSDEAEQVHFDVVMTLRGEMPTNGPTAVPTTRASAGVPWTAPGVARAPTSGAPGRERASSLSMPRTGAIALMALPVAGILVGVGWWLFALRGARRSDEADGETRR